MRVVLILAHDRGACMRKREFETERGTLRYWMSENDEETAQLVFS